MLSESLKELLMKNSKVFHFKQGEFLFKEGELARTVFYIYSGVIKLNKTTPEGNQLTLEFLNQGDIVGNANVFLLDDFFITSAEAFTDCEVGILSKDTLEELLKQNPNYLVDYIAWLQNDNRVMQSKLRDLIMYGKKGALYSTLIRLSNTYGIKTENGIMINLKLTNVDLGEIIGIARESTNRLLNELKKNNIISISKQMIVIHDIEYLRRTIHCENCPLQMCRM